ncbi:uncharacterized protein CTRU02_210244 [Colletotrichum truncatum]|uniref:Uncharacterized protein n=1 Tax=Colletotrichum truncatum TaxID=5467 RepID=A0ACC3YUQ4_COLTU|nr:uncharacterized protein CTRU02_11454 [Colletotrichum truncatum]KAF6785829.1 hypothetical protein CTRU02_11454 [Colletotrichum truncatum]
MVDNWNYEVESPEGFADASREKRSNSDDELEVHDASTSRPWSRASTPPPSYTNPILENQFRCGELFTFEAETRSLVREEIRQQPQKQQTAFFVTFFGCFCWLVFEITAIALSTEAAKDLDHYDLESDVKTVINVVTLLSVIDFVLVVLSPILYRYIQLLGFIALPALTCLEGLALGSFTIFVAVANLQNGSCDKYTRDGTECWSGLRLATASGAFKVLLL